MSFKDMVAADIRNVFLNTDGFAEHRTIVYDGTTYEDVPISIQNFTESDRPRITAPGSGRGGSDSAAGLSLVTAVLYCARNHLGGELPEQNQLLKIKNTDSDYFRKYTVVSSKDEMGMLRVELRAVK